MSVLDLKHGYNAILEREHKAEKWMETVSAAQVEKWLPEYNKIISSLGMLIPEIEALENRKLTQKEVLDGFAL